MLCNIFSLSNTTNLGPGHTAPFLYKNRDQKFRFVKVFTLIHTSNYRNIGFENAIECGFSRRRRFLKTLQYSTMTIIESPQCELTKTDTFGSIFAMWRINVNGQIRYFSLCFYTKTEKCEQVASIKQERSSVNRAKVASINPGHDLKFF